jgi:hypothetical protein
MAVITTQQRSARRIAAIARSVLIASVSGIPAPVVPRDGQSEAVLIPASEATPTLVRRASMKDTYGDAATPPASRAERVGRGSR